MSRLTDLLKRTKDMDAALGRELEQEFKVLSDRRAFGLNFERHKPEMIELPSRAIRQGDKVRVLPPRGSTKKPDNKIWIVQKIEKAEDKAHLTHQTNDGVEEKKVSLDNVRVIADIHDPIYPGLVSTGKVERGAGDDILYGGGGQDVFVLGSDKDVVKDFALGTDKIQIDPGDTDPTTLEALLSAADLRIDKLVVNDSGSNSQDRTDTYIYARNSTDSTEDDVVLMVLEDISTDLTVADFSIL